MMKKSILVIVLIALGATGFFLAKEPTPQPSAVKTEATAAASQNANATAAKDGQSRQVDMTNAMSKPSEYTAEEMAVYDTYRKFYTYKINQNIQGLNTILDPDFHLVHMTGYNQSKDEWLSQVTDGQMRYFGDTEERGIVKVDVDKATLQSRNKVDARIYGNRRVWNLELNFDMEKRNGQWIILEAVAHSY